MFSAIVLVCLNGLKDKDFCDIYVNTEFFKTYEECMADIDDVISRDYFNFYIDEDNYFTVVDFRCVNWNDIRVSY